MLTGHRIVVSVIASHQSVVKRPFQEWCELSVALSQLRQAFCIPSPSPTIASSDIVTEPFACPFSIEALPRDAPFNVSPC